MPTKGKARFATSKSYLESKGSDESGDDTEPKDMRCNSITVGGTCELSKGGGSCRHFGGGESRRRGSSHGQGCCWLTYARRAVPVVAMRLAGRSSLLVIMIVVMVVTRG
jgi:hypothetical protein